jgi:DNA polymerase-1
MTKTLLIDVMNLAYRALHTTGPMRYEDRPTGTLYGIWKTCRKLAHQFRTSDLAFCFDSKTMKRRDIYPQYKGKRSESRKAEDEDKKSARQEMHDQVAVLPQLLRDSGFVNLFRLSGYEADDVIASAVQNNTDREFVIVSADQDCYQLLEEGRVTQYSLSTDMELRESDFFATYGIPPVQWAGVKAWAGCASDSVEGLKLIGEKKAIQFLLGKYSNPKRFTDELEIYNRNIQLTKLPFPGCPVIRIAEQPSQIDWNVIGSFIGSAESIVTGV